MDVSSLRERTLLSLSLPQGLECGEHIGSAQKTFVQYMEQHFLSLHCVPGTLHLEAFNPYRNPPTIAREKPAFI